MLIAGHSEKIAPAWGWIRSFWSAANGMGRFFFIALGWGAVGLGLLGIVLPVVPTTPFLLVAAFAFGKSSPRARKWLIEHAHFGPTIRDWEERGAISRRAKLLATSMMVLVIAFSVWKGLPLWVLTLQGILIAAGAAFVLTRPD
ncbi:YbaN family protein [Aliiroseovarius crassostreae]|uniref:YbaN family protein n=1 Tax=Aliiroseovarius crassostreae TaxID=154981 RepID=UPI00223A6AD6|nr:YbaN family protein [Aliiroseovarius crassostreae]